MLALQLARRDFAVGGDPAPPELAVFEAVRDELAPDRRAVAAHEAYVVAALATRDRVLLPAEARCPPSLGRAGFISEHLVETRVRIDDHVPTGAHDADRVAFASDSLGAEAQPILGAAALGDVTPHAREPPAPESARAHLV